MGFTLKAARVNIGLSQEIAAKKIGISTDTLSKYERAISFPGVLTIAAIERVYGVEYKDLIFLPRIYGLTVNNDLI